MILRWQAIKLEDFLYYIGLLPLKVAFFSSFRFIRIKLQFICIEIKLQPSEKVETAINNFFDTTHIETTHHISLDTILRPKKNCRCV